MSQQAQLLLIVAAACTIWGETCGRGFHYRWPGFDINFVVIRMDEILVCMRLPGFLMAKSWWG
jgi:hypothetical protein